MSTPDSVDEQLMLDISDAFNSRDPDRIANLFHEDAIFWLSRGPEPEGRALVGKAAIRKAVADRFKVISDMKWDHKAYYYLGNAAVSVWYVRGTGKDGEKLNYQGCDIYEFKDRKIWRKDTYWKMIEHKDRL